MSDENRKGESRKETEARQYDRARDVGIPHDYAKRTAERASELVHRGQDRLSNDGNPRRKDR